MNFDLYMSPYYFYALLGFFVGTVVGSFLNVVALRLLREEDFVFRPSYCYNCNNKLLARDNIPIVSWLVLRGKCRHCKAPISIQYPLVELVTGLIFFLTLLRFGETWETLFYLWLFSNFVVISITDLKEEYIFDINSMGLIPVGLVFTFFNLAHIQGSYTLDLFGAQYPIPEIFVAALTAVVVSMVVFYLLNLCSKMMFGSEGFGEGDTRLMMGIGSFIGWKGMLLSLGLGILLQVVVGIPYLLFQWYKKHAMRPLIYLLIGFVLVGAPYLLQLYHIDETVMFVANIGFGVTGLIFALNAFRMARKMELGLHYLPFGPALCLAAMIIIFYHRY